MNEYISRQDALRRINDFVEMAQYRMLSIPKDSGLYRFTEIQYGDRKNIYNSVADIPAADVRPVVYGEWIPPNYPVCCAIRCSVCGETEYLDEPEQYKDWDFCPHCGADMRGEKERNNG